MEHHAAQEFAVAFLLRGETAGGDVALTLTSDDRTATVLVRDHGVGLAPEELPHVFERFYRGHHLRRLEGTGLGLHICEAIVAAHGGRMWAESEGPGKGSTFGFTLPLRPAAESN